MVTIYTHSNFNKQQIFKHNFFCNNDEEDYNKYVSKLSKETDYPYIKRSREIAMSYLGYGYEDLCVVKQVHSTIALAVDKSWVLDKEPEADAMVTTTPNLVLGIQTADCVPILFVDHQAKVIGAAHAGWRGARHGIIENTVDLMVAMGATLTNIHSLIGPCIRQESYEIGPEFYNDFIDEQPSNNKYFINSVKSNHFMFNLPLYVYDKLSKKGIKYIEDINIDTYKDNKLFSFRRSTLTGAPYKGSVLSSIVLL